jgi:hypothetical protein
LSLTLAVYSTSTPASQSVSKLETTAAKDAARLTVARTSLLPGRAIHSLQLALADRVLLAWASPSEWCCCDSRPLSNTAIASAQRERDVIVHPLFPSAVAAFHHRTENLQSPIALPERQTRSFFSTSHSHSPRSFSLVLGCRLEVTSPMTIHFLDASGRFSCLDLLLVSQSTHDRASR